MIRISKRPKPKKAACSHCNKKRLLVGAALSDSCWSGTAPCPCKKSEPVGVCVGCFVDLIEPADRVTKLRKSPRNRSRRRSK